MALKNILIILDTSKHVSQRLDVALDLAVRHDAHLTGLFVVASFEMPSYIGAQVPAEMVDAHRQAVNQMAADAQAQFDAAVAKAGHAHNAEFHAATGFPVDVAAAHACYSDLTVVGQIDPDESLDMPVVSPDELVMVSGGPMLVVPYIGAKVPACRHIMVAWNGDREASRAVSDCRALMQAADHVTVLSIDSPVSHSVHSTAPSRAMVERLKRHGIDAEARHVEANGLEPADVLLNNISDLGADLLVMGAYGHSRLREMLVGGATRTIMHHMTVPVLMSH